MDEELAAERDKLARVTTSLHEALRCAVCAQVVRAPVRMCSAGHVTCQCCVSDMTCEHALLTQEPACISKLLSVLPRFCKHRGCNHVVVPDTEDTHEDFCGFRSITCRQTDCSEKIQVSFMMEHYKTHHPNRILVTSSTENHCWPDFRPGEDATVNTPGFLDQHFFYISRHYSSDEQHQRFTLEAFYVGKPTAEYFLTVRCERGDVVCSKTIKPIVMLGNSDLDGLAVICKTEVDSSDLFLKVSRSFLPYFVNDDKQLEFTYKLFRL